MLFLPDTYQLDFESQLSKLVEKLAYDVQSQTWK